MLVQDRSQETWLLEKPRPTAIGNYAVTKRQTKGPCPVSHVIPLYSDCDTSLPAVAFRTLLNIILCHLRCLLTTSNLT